MEEIGLPSSAFQGQPNVAFQGQLVQVSRTLLLERERVHCCHSAPHASPRAVCGRRTRRAAVAARDGKNGQAPVKDESEGPVLYIIDHVYPGKYSQLCAYAQLFAIFKCALTQIFTIAN